MGLGPSHRWIVRGAAEVKVCRLATLFLTAPCLVAGLCIGVALATDFSACCAGQLQHAAGYDYDSAGYRFDRQTNGAQLNIDAAAPVEARGISGCGLVC